MDQSEGALQSGSSSDESGGTTNQEKELSGHDLWLRGYASSGEPAAEADGGGEPAAEAQKPQHFRLGPGLHPLAEIAFPIFNSEGIGVLEGDPEFESLRSFLSDPSPSTEKLSAFVLATKAAADAKRARLAGPKQKPMTARNGSEMWRQAYDRAKKR